MKTPLQLGPFTKADSAIFFGREEDTAALYQLVTRNRLVVVYGPAGCGKTSLVQCGLYNYFDKADWLPFFVRRHRDINQSLLQVLQQTSVVASRYPSLTAKDIPEVIKLIGSHSMRPVYLIFDQIEDMLFLGAEEEKATFSAMLHQLTSPNSNIAVNVIIIVREGSLALLEAFATAIPWILNSRIRVEHPRLESLKQIFMQSCVRLNINVTQEIADRIVAAVQEKGNSLLLLQLYLHTILEFATPHNQPVNLSDEQFHRISHTDELLQQYMHESCKLIQQRLEERWPKVESNAVRFVLDCFVSQAGLRQKVPYTLSNNEVHLEIEWDKPIGSTAGYITDCLAELETAHLLINDGTGYELSHDAFATYVRNQRPVGQQQKHEWEENKRLRAAEEKMYKLTFQLKKQHALTRLLIISIIILIAIIIWLTLKPLTQ